MGTKLVFSSGVSHRRISLFTEVDIYYSVHNSAASYYICQFTLLHCQLLHLAIPDLCDMVRVLSATSPPPTTGCVTIPFYHLLSLQRTLCSYRHCDSLEYHLAQICVQTKART